MQGAAAGYQAAGTYRGSQEDASAGQNDTRDAANNPAGTQQQFLLGYQGAGFPPAWHAQPSQANPTAGGLRQSLTSDIRLNTPVPGGAQCPDQESMGLQQQLGLVLQGVFGGDTAYLVCQKVRQQDRSSSVSTGCVSAPT